MKCLRPSEVWGEGRRGFHDCLAGSPASQHFRCSPAQKLSKSHPSGGWWRPCCAGIIKEIAVNWNQQKPCPLLYRWGGQQCGVESANPLITGLVPWQPDPIQMLPRSPQTPVISLAYKKTSLLQDPKDFRHLMSGEGERRQNIYFCFNHKLPCDYLNRI